MGTTGDATPADAAVFRLAVEAGNVGTWFWDRAAGTVRWNDRLEAMFGLEPGSFPGTFDAYAELLRTDREVVLANIEAGMAAGRPWTFEHRVERPDGTVRYLEGRGEPLLAPSGEAVGAAGVTLDVTERRLADEAAARRRVGLEALVASVPRVIRAASRPDAAREACTAAIEAFGADLVGVVELDGARLRVLAHAPAEDDRVPAGLEIDLADRPAVLADLQGGAPSIVRRDGTVLDDAAAALLDMVGARAVLRVPLAVGGAAQFALFCAWHRDRVFDAVDEDIAARVAEQLGFALERFLRLEAQVATRSLADRLQLALVPAPDVSGAGVEAIAVYRPGEARLQLGGDFFDALDRDGTVMFCIGDVSGHGPEAAALAAQVRAAWRGLTIAGHPPVDCLRHLDELVARSTDDDSFITLLCGWIAVDDSTLELATAGHPAPFLVGAASTAPLVVRAGSPLGTGAAAASGATTHPLPAGWALLCVTDGLYEGRRNPATDERYGYDRLIERLAHETLGGFDEERLRELVQEIEARNGGPLADDVALLLLTGPLPAGGA